MKHIYNSVLSLVNRFGSRDPKTLLEGLSVVAEESDSFKDLAGFSFYSNRTYYVILNRNLSEPLKRTILAHELGHICLHKEALRLSPIHERDIYNTTSKLEYEANIFASELLISDEDIEKENDFFALAKRLGVPPDLLSFKLLSLKKRGFNLELPFVPDSVFLKKQGE